MYKIIGTDQKEYGPISSDQIIRWIAQGRVNAQTRVQADGGEWKTLGQFPEFSAAFGNSFSASPSPVAARPTPTPMPIASPAAAPQTSGLAIASLVLGILGIFSCGLSAIVGLILGIVSLSRIRKSNGAVGGHGLAISGIIVSSVFLLFMVPVGAAMILPALAKAKERAQTVQCVNTLKKLSAGARNYAATHEHRLPAAATWNESMERYMFSPADFKCPADTTSDRCSYAFNAQLDGVDIRNVNPNTVLFFEADGGWDASGGQEMLTRQPRHGHMVVVAFVDGHVEQVLPQRLATLRWDP